MTVRTSIVPTIVTLESHMILFLLQLRLPFAPTNLLPLFACLRVSRESGEQPGLRMSWSPSERRAELFFSISKIAVEWFLSQGCYWRDVFILSKTLLLKSFSRIRWSTMHTSRAKYTAKQSNKYSYQSRIQYLSKYLQGTYLESSTCAFQNYETQYTKPH